MSCVSNTTLLTSAGGHASRTSQVHELALANMPEPAPPVAEDGLA
jgi:hypothetical protein